MQLVATLLAITLLSGCVVGTGNLELPIPEPTTVQSAAKSLQLGTIVDARVFEQKPTQANIPSVDGNLATITAEQRA
ncbi:MAG: hypothetical protein FJ194_12310 [Gammaproteobacteria bacterium]|nr:hypothetical protein [Gammaproteobacteria bacterium]